MTVAFVVLAHTQPKTLEKLLDKLAPYPVFLHIDRRALRKEFGNLPLRDVRNGVILNPKPKCLHWGGYSILQAMIETLDLATKNADSTIKHFAFLSGQCYPLRPVDEFAAFLDSTDRPVLCRGISLDGMGVMSKRRITQMHWLDGVPGHLKKVLPLQLGTYLRKALYYSTLARKKQIPERLHACGSQWVSVPRELAVEIVAAYYNGDFEYLRHAFAPDEVAIPSYVYNTQWQHLTPVGELESSQGNNVSAFPNYHWLLPSMSGLVRLEDLDIAVNSKSFFARKFDEYTINQVCQFYP